MCMKRAGTSTKKTSAQLLRLLPYNHAYSLRVRPAKLLLCGNEMEAANTTALISSRNR